MIDEDKRDDDVIDPEDDEVEIEDEDVDGEFNPDADKEVDDEEEKTDDPLIPEEEEALLDDGLEDDDVDTDILNADAPKVSELAEVDVAQYLITGLVDYTDEQGNIVGQLPIGSTQELPVVVGDAAVEAGQAERVQ